MFTHLLTSGAPVQALIPLLRFGLASWCRLSPWHCWLLAAFFSGVNKGFSDFFVFVFEKNWWGILYCSFIWDPLQIFAGVCHGLFICSCYQLKNHGISSVSIPRSMFPKIKARVLGLSRLFFWVEKGEERCGKKRRENVGFCFSDHWCGAIVHSPNLLWLLKIPIKSNIIVKLFLNCPFYVLFRTNFSVYFKKYFINAMIFFCISISTYQFCPPLSPSLNRNLP